MFHTSKQAHGSMYAEICRPVCQWWCQAYISAGHVVHIYRQTHLYYLLINCTVWIVIMLARQKVFWESRKVMGCVLANAKIQITDIVNGMSIYGKEGQTFGLRCDGGRGHIWTCPEPTCTLVEHWVALTAWEFPREKAQMPFLCNLFTKSFEWKFDVSCKEIKGCQLSCFLVWWCTANHYH